MFDPCELLKNIRRRLSDGLDRHPPKADRYYTLTLPLPGFRLKNLAQTGPRWCWWSKPIKEEYRLGAGEVLRICAGGAERFPRLAADFEASVAKWDRYDPDATGVQPILFTGFAFSPDDPMTGSWQGMPNAALCLPEVLLQQEINTCTLSCSLAGGRHKDRAQQLEDWMDVLTQLIEAAVQHPGPPGYRTSLPLSHSEPAREQWIDWVHKAKRDIAAQQLEKVVLARQIRVRAERRLNPMRLMSTLNCLYPDSVLFATRQDDLIFVSASPELLLSCDKGEICSDAVAGTAPRAADETKDQQLGEALLSDEKSIHEHRLVVENIHNVLQRLCSEVQPIQAPRLKRLRAMQHLWTELRGQLKPGIGLFDAAALLHPTAAVNGTPVQQAFRWLAETETFSRGWYTGAAGWINALGNGELAVLIRCAQLQGYDAELYAGAGITAGSDPDSEYRETELKLAAMLEALEEA
ncbi:MAG: isochorismate synthase [Chromatiales bacterium]|jgi:menaquinone-specific isochorismate synthase